MKGQYYIGNGQFALRDVPLGELGDHDVRIQVMASGISVGDVSRIASDTAPSPSSSSAPKDASTAASAEECGDGAERAPLVLPVAPRILGHEFSGVVDQVGRHVHCVRPGDCVSVNPHIYCGTCLPCRSGHSHFCTHVQMIGTDRDGGFAEFCDVPDTQVIRMEPVLGFETMAMADPLACCVHAVQRIQPRLGDLCVVVGGGTIGLLMAQLLLLRGAARVVVSEASAERRKLVQTLGVPDVMDPSDGDPRDQLKSVTGRTDADVVIECTGDVAATHQAMILAGMGAQVLLFSRPECDHVYPLNLRDMYAKELTLMSAYAHPDCHAQAAALLNAGRIRVEGIITHRYPLSQLPEAIRMQGASESIKVLVTPNELEEITL